MALKKFNKIMWLRLKDDFLAMTGRFAKTSEIVRLMHVPAALSLKEITTVRLRNNRWETYQA